MEFAQLAKHVEYKQSSPVSLHLTSNLKRHRMCNFGEKCFYKNTPKISGFLCPYDHSPDRKYRHSVLKSIESAESKFAPEFTPRSATAAIIRAPCSAFGAAFGATFSAESDQQRLAKQCIHGSQCYFITSLNPRTGMVCKFSHIEEPFRPLKPLQHSVLRPLQPHSQKNSQSVSVRPKDFAKCSKMMSKMLRYNLDLPSNAGLRLLTSTADRKVLINDIVPHFEGFLFSDIVSVICGEGRDENQFETDGEYVWINEDKSF